MRSWIFRQKGNAILGQVTRLVRDWYAIKVLIMNAVTRFRDFSLFWKGWHEKNKKKIYMGEYRKGVKSCNRVPESFWKKIFQKKVGGIFCWIFWRIFVYRSFCGVFVSWEFLWGFWQNMVKIGLKSVALTMFAYATML